MLENHKGNQVESKDMGKYILGFSLPPKWSLGYSLCRKTGKSDPDLAVETLEAMNEAEIPFDSDCISEAVLTSAFTPSSIGQNLFMHSQTCLNFKILNISQARIWTGP